MQALIFNSGIGKRMGEFTKKNHKSMVLLNNGETIFERQIRILGKCGIRKFVITTGPHKEQLIHITKKPQFQKYEFIFVENPVFDKTNYIYSMHLAKNHIKGKLLLLHGDLVFSEKLIKDLLADERSNLGLVNKTLPLPQKDFKVRIKENVIQEIAIDIFDDNCFPFQPLYKLDYKTVEKWFEKVSEFIAKDNDKVYAENALNEILNDLNIELFSYENYYIDEIDTIDDLERVAHDIRFYDYAEQNIYINENITEILEKIIKINSVKKPFVVVSKPLLNDEILSEIKEIFKNFVVFTEFNPNPLYEEVICGLKKFEKENCDFIISFGGGSAIDVAKAIKLFSFSNKEDNLLSQKHGYSSINHLCIPSTAGTGSESTRYSVLYYNGEKQTVTHDSIIPEYVLLEPRLLINLPDYYKKSTMLDAFCQAIESFWSVNSTTQSKTYATEAIKLIIKNYKNYVNNINGYKEIMLASNLSGKSINISQTTAAHAMSYKITSLFGIAHGHAVALTLPHLWKYMIENSEKIIDPRGVKYLNKMFLDLSVILGGSDIESGINIFLEIYNDLHLEINDKISNEQLEELVKSVNYERLKNTPIKLNQQVIEKIYRKVYVTNEKTY